MQCSACQGRSIAATATDDPANRPRLLSHVKDFWRENDPLRVAPEWVEGQDFVYAPDHIAEAASEAYKCHSIGSYMAAILMARTSIEAAAKNKGIKKGNLFQKIDKLAEEGLLRRDIKQAAHQVRIFGNDMAHGDIQVGVSKLESEQVLMLLSFILQDLYQVSEVMSELGISLDTRKSEGDA